MQNLPHNLQFYRGYNLLLQSLSIIGNLSEACSFITYEIVCLSKNTRISKY